MCAHPPSHPPSHPSSPPMPAPPHATPAALADAVALADAPAAAPAACARPSVSHGSRRRRIWELGAHAHCPVIGVCLPISQVRKLVDKVLGGQTQASDYELHCGVNSECRQRSAVAEAVNKALDQRFDTELRLTRPLKSTEALAQWWQQRSAGGQQLAGALWATLTHPRCDAVLEERVLQDVHMRQHQAGAQDRADLARLEALAHENRVLGRELAAAQQRATRQAEEFSRRTEQQQAERMRLRAELMRRDTLLAALQEDLRQLHADVPELPARQALSQQVARQIERMQDLERSLLHARHEAQRERHRADSLDAELQRGRSTALRTGAAQPVEAGCEPLAPPLPPAGPEPLGPDLADRSVLCVGGRQGSVPVYRQLIEQAGAHFLHHDGGEEDNPARLDHTLAAADLVICQTGCISHEAYWRVKDHCKRTGKPCVFVDKPSRSSLQRALAAPAASGEEPPR